MNSPIDIARAEREVLRWIILSALWHARPYGCSEYVITRTAQDVPLGITPDVVRRELNYLDGRGFVKLESDQPLWHAKITPNGEDLVDYRSKCPDGIARPPKW